MIVLEISFKDPLGKVFLLVALNFMALSAGADVWQEPHSGIQFTRVASGCFILGADEAGKLSRRVPPQPPRNDELPAHEVCVDGFWLGVHEVTRKQWDRVMGEGSDAIDSNRPKDHVTPLMARRFIVRMNELYPSGIEQFRLPTEAEWEYACRSGEAESYIAEHTPEDVQRIAAMAWFREPMRWDPETRGVGEMVPNGWGLYDMLGNVWELTEDTYLESGYSQHSRNNPRVTVPSQRQVIRGGSYKSRFNMVRCSVRNFALKNDPMPTVGLRVLRVGPRDPAAITSPRD